MIHDNEPAFSLVRIVNCKRKEKSKFEIIISASVCVNVIAAYLLLCDERCGTRSVQHLNFVRLGFTSTCIENGQNVQMRVVGSTHRLFISAFMMASKVIFNDIYVETMLISTSQLIYSIERLLTVTVLE